MVASNDKPVPVAVNCVEQGRWSQDLVDAAHLLERDERAQNVRYLILGSGALEEPLRERISRLGLEHRFLLVPRVPYAEVPEYVAACDVCVAPYNPDRHPHFH